MAGRNEAAIARALQSLIVALVEGGTLDIETARKIATGLVTQSEIADSGLIGKALHQSLNQLEARDK